MDTTYKMRQKLNCGPEAVSFATGIDYQRVIDTWKWPKTDDWRCNLRDSPGAHFRVLRKLGIPWRVVELGEIMAGSLPADKVVVLLHGKDDPETVEPEPITLQHWAVVQFVQRERTFIQGWAFVQIPGVWVFTHLGNGTIVDFNEFDFAGYYSRGTPACAYVVGQGSLDANKWERAWDWLMEKIIGG